MSRQSTDAFVAWLDEQEERLGWTDYRLAAEAKISASVLSRARSGLIPKWDACFAIAQAVKQSPITVFRKAGLLPPGPDGNVRFEDWEHLIGQLAPEDEAELRQIAEMKIERRKKEQRLRALKPKRAG
jgi:transcriptional regulator with XRE-family HTH domain